MWIALGILAMVVLSFVAGSIWGRKGAAWAINELREENDALGEKLDAAYKELADGKN